MPLILPDERKLVPQPPKTIEVSNKEIGDRLRAIRRARGMTQTRLAEVLDTHFTAISQIERGLRGLTVHQLVKLSRALGVSPNQLLGEIKSKDITRPRNPRLLRRLQRIEELPPAQQRMVLSILDSLLKTHGRGNGQPQGRRK
jgi:transcriptional regulator with XRE-family HTH domain